MPSTSSPAAKGATAERGGSLEARLERLDRLAHKLDNRFEVFGLRFGWDSIFGLIPGVGDVAAALPGAWMIYEASRMGVRRRVLARMALNSGTDLVIGGIPLLGDAFDVAFKANRRNIELLKREMARPRPPGSDNRETRNA